MILPHEIHTDIATHHDLFELFKDFADSQSWDIQRYEKNNVQWAFDSGSGQFDFIAGTESYIQLESPGYGNQTLHYRIRVENTLSDPLHESVKLGAFKSGDTSLDHTSSQHPVNRAAPGGVSSWNSAAHHNHSFKPTSIQKCWFFGDDKFLIIVAQFSSTYIQVMSFGSPELKNTSESEGNYVGRVSSISSSKWYTLADVLPFDSGGNDVLYDGNAADMENTCRFNTLGSPQGSIFRYGNLIVVNSYTDKRPQRKPDILVKKDSDGLFSDLGKLPIFRIDVSNLNIGEVLKYGTEEYIVFPALRHDRVKGFSVRIA